MGWKKRFGGGAVVVVEDEDETDERGVKDPLPDPPTRGLKDVDEGI